jgi:hypothetical protein
LRTILETKRATKPLNKQRFINPNKLICYRISIFSTFKL